MYFGVDYYPEHWPQERWETDARLMREAGINLARLAEFAWALLEPEEGVYDFTWLDQAIGVLARYGIAVILGTPTATPPAWLCQRYPEIMRVGRDGRRVAFGMRRQYCATNPAYRALSRGIVEAMAKHYADHPAVVGWQIDNEFGCHDSTRCYCPACQSAFQAWAQRRYGSLAALNDAWGARFWSHVYTSWSQIPLPTDAVGVSNPCLELDYWRFASEQTVAYQQAQVDALRALCPEHSVTTNMMGFGFQDINYYELARPLDFVSWDNYPGYQPSDPAAVALSHSLMRGLLDRPFWVMEQQAGPTGWQTMSRAPKPGQLRLWAYQAIAHGADAVVFFRWRTCRFNTEEYWHGILDHDGVPRRRYQEIKAMGGEIARIGDQLVGAASPKAVAMLFSYDDSFAFRLQPNAREFSYSELFSNYYRAFHQLGLPVDVVSPEADLSGYRVVAAPTLHVLPHAWADKLRRYVEQGGWLIVGARSGVKDTNNRVVDLALPGLLRDLCGVEVAEYDPLGRNAANAVRFEGENGAGCTVHTWCDVLQPFDADVVARYTEDYYAGQAAITQRQVGAGGVIYVGCMGNGDLYGAVAKLAAQQAQLAPLLIAPRGVEVTARENRGVTYLFVLNHSAVEQAIELPFPCRDLLTERAYQSWLALPPYAVMILATG